MMTGTLSLRECATIRNALERFTNHFPFIFLICAFAEIEHHLT
jgi:hypothetical protein